MNELIYKKKIFNKFVRKSEKKWVQLDLPKKRLWRVQNGRIFINERNDKLRI